MNGFKNTTLVVIAQVVVNQTTVRPRRHPNTEIGRTSNIEDK
jgi:hypothetical protein